MRVLAGDIGGTKTLVAVFETQDGKHQSLEKLRVQRFASAEHPGLESILENFLSSETIGFDAAAFAVAGPVHDEVCKATNLPWIVDGNLIAKKFGIPRVHLRNDFGAVAFGVQHLKSDEVEVIQSGVSDPHGMRAVIGAGTGLGQALLAPCDGKWNVIENEGGHTDFAPRNELEIGLLRFMLKRHKRVSWERLVSGPGLLALYDYLVEAGEIDSHPAVEAAKGHADPSEIMGKAALERNDPACRRVVDLFLELYGAEAGNLALKCLPTGGLFIAGGIAPKLLPILKGPFLPAFMNKGRMSPLLEDVPIYVVKKPDIGLWGAAAIALEPNA
ncbi:MAG: glucokinase [Myxococcales bacterium]|nr:MAG: glucokinase [Myxococcales bacterium]